MSFDFASSVNRAADAFQKTSGLVVPTATRDVLIMAAQKHAPAIQHAVDVALLSEETVENAVHEQLADAVANAGPVALATMSKDKILTEAALTASVKRRCRLIFWCW